MKERRGTGRSTRPQRLGFWLISLALVALLVVAFYRIILYLRGQGYSIAFAVGIGAIIWVVVLLYFQRHERAG